METTPAQDHAEFMRRIYDAQLAHDRKLIAVARFLTFYAIGGFIVSAALALLIR